MSYPKTIIITAVPNRSGIDLLSRRANLQNGFKPNIQGKPISLIGENRNVKIIPMHPKKPLTLVNEDESYIPTRKRQRLDHLSMEEKIMRRKLKNRVAAQSARDRKKMKMDELEVVVQQLEAEKAELEEENARLKNMNMLLETENQYLKKGTTTTPSEKELKQELETDLTVKMETGASLEHAEGTGAPPSFSLDDAVRLLADDNESDDIFDLLEHCSEELFKCGIKPEDIDKTFERAGLGNGVSTSEMVGTATEDMESIKELIRFDHVYTKECNSPTVMFLSEQGLATVPEVIISDPLSPCSAPENVLQDVSSLCSSSDSFSKSLLSPSSSESGYDSAKSPFSEPPTDSLLGDDQWEDSFSELFPSLV